LLKSTNKNHLEGVGEPMITVVRRFHKHEIEAAVNELVKRGFEIIHPITEIKTIGSRSSQYKYSKGRYQNRQSEISTGYVAKLRAGERK
jgi:hypothetical protein